MFGKIIMFLFQCKEPGSRRDFRFALFINIFLFFMLLKMFTLILFQEIPNGLNVSELFGDS